MRHAYLVQVLVVLFAVGQPACDGAKGAKGENGGDPAVSAARPLPTMAFERYGYPGPWWRHGATQSDFDGDVSSCRGASRSAREAAPSETRKDAAYRAFLDCMLDHDWHRGHAPSREQASG